MVYVIIKKNMNQKTHLSFINLGDIENLSGLSRPTILKYVEFIENCGYFKIVKTGANLHYNSYLFPEQHKDEKFEKFVLTYAKIMPGRVSCTTYAAAVAKIADDLGVKYRIYAGFCVPKSFPKYEEDKKAFKEKRDNGVEHPMFPTHVYLETAKGVIYEYYNGEKDIDHIDSVVIG